jgi:glutamyl-tRNA synthetase
MSLFNLAFVTQAGGQFILRIEDTDRARYREDSEQQVFDMLHWLGLQWDEGPDIGGPVGPYRQSERLDRYPAYAERLLADGHAYWCWCSTERLAQMREEQQKAKLPTGYDRLCYGMTRDERAALPGFNEPPVLRMYVPEDAPLTFQDLIRGEVRAPRPDDQVLMKADGYPTYHLASVVDDHEMGITHVVRGEEWISSTPKHVLLYQWLGVEPPKFAHMPLLRNADKSKISKRKNPAARLTWFREQGYLPEALRNFLALMGYSLPDGAEIFSFTDLAASFDWSRVNTVGPVFDLDKLNWLNGHYIRALSVEEFAERMLDHLRFAGVLGQLDDEQIRRVRAISPHIQERISYLAEGYAMIAFLLCSTDELAVDDAAVASLGESGPSVLRAAYEALTPLSGWAAASIEAALRAALVDGLGLKPRLAFTPVRLAVTGQRISPPLFESIEVLGREETLARIQALQARLSRA